MTSNANVRTGAETRSGRGRDGDGTKISRCVRGNRRYRSLSGGVWKDSLMSSRGEGEATEEGTGIMKRCRSGTTRSEAVHSYSLGQQQA